jgi:hypothetical protein
MCGKRSDSDARPWALGSGQVLRIRFQPCRLQPVAHFLDLVCVRKTRPICTAKLSAPRSEDDVGGDVLSFKRCQGTRIIAVAWGCVLGGRLLALVGLVGLVGFGVGLLGARRWRARRSTRWRICSSSTPWGRRAGCRQARGKCCTGRWLGRNSFLRRALGRRQRGTWHQRALRGRWRGGRGGCAATGAAGGHRLRRIEAGILRRDLDRQVVAGVFLARNQTPSAAARQHPAPAQPRRSDDAVRASWQVLTGRADQPTHRVWWRVCRVRDRRSRHLNLHRHLYV